MTFININVHQESMKMFMNSLKILVYQKKLRNSQHSNYKNKLFFDESKIRIL